MAPKLLANTRLGLASVRSSAKFIEKFWIALSSRFRAAHLQNGQSRHSFGNVIAFKGGCGSPTSSRNAPGRMRLAESSRFSTVSPRLIAPEGPAPPMAQPTEGCRHDSRCKPRETLLPVTCAK